MQDSEDYTPFGPEWEAEIMKHGKKGIVALYKDACIKLKALDTPITFSNGVVFPYPDSELPAIEPVFYVADVKAIAVGFHQAYINDNTNIEATARSFDFWFKLEDWVTMPNPVKDGDMTRTYERRHDLAGNIVETWGVTMEGPPLAAGDAERLALLRAGIELTKSGYGGIDKTGKIVDRRENPDAVPIPKNELMSVPEPKPWPSAPGNDTHLSNLGE